MAKTKFGYLPTRSVGKEVRIRGKSGCEYLKRQTIRFTPVARCLNAVVEKLDETAQLRTASHRKYPSERIRARYSAHTVHRNSLGGIGASNFPFYFLIRCLTDQAAVWAEPRVLIPRSSW